MTTQTPTPDNQTPTLLEDQTTDPEAKLEILKLLFQDQRSEMGYRREREYRIFTWSSSLMLALIGALLITKQTENIIWKPYGLWGNLIVSVAIIMLMIYSITWQRRNNKFRSKNAEVISRIQNILHCFEKGYFTEGVMLYPKEWQKGEWKEPSLLTRLTRFLRTNYESATLILGILALLMIWLA